MLAVCPYYTLAAISISCLIMKSNTLATAILENYYVCSMNEEFLCLELDPYYMLLLT